MSRIPRIHLAPIVAYRGKAAWRSNAPKWRWLRWSLAAIGVLSGVFAASVRLVDDPLLSLMLTLLVASSIAPLFAAAEHRPGP